MNILVIYYYDLFKNCDFVQLIVLGKTEIKNRLSYTYFEQREH